MFLFIFGLGNMALTDPDETFYAQTAKEMLENGEWATPMIFGKPQFEKPVLYYLLVRMSFMVFGVNEFAARLPSALFGILGILGIYLLGRVLFSPLSGFLSGLVMATCIEYLILSRACVTDIVLAVFILYCFLFFLLGWTGKGKGYYLASSVMAALAVLTKGPIGIFIPFVVITLYLSLSRQWGKVRGVPVFASILIFLIISLPWYIVMLRIHGDALVSEFFGVHNVIRFMEPEHRIGISPFFYIPVVLAGFYPWTFFLPFGAWNMYRHDKPGGQGTEVKGYRLFLLLWFLVVFLFFSAARTKLVTYIFPLFPVLAVVTGRFLELSLVKTGDRNIERYTTLSYIFFFIFTVLGLGGIYVFIMKKYPAIAGGAALSEVIFVLGVILSLLFYRSKRKALAFYSIIITIVILTLPVVLSVLPVVGDLESSRFLSVKFKELAGPGEPLGGENDHRRGVAFYTGRTEIADVHPYQDLVDFVSRKERVWCIMQKKHYDQLRDNMPDSVTEPLFRSGKYVLVNNKPGLKIKDQE
ncbi:MAG: glycosyltransferase family 39 protein [Candidatus Omnitrophota bacterium]